MAGFGTTMSKLIEDDREYYRELATKKRDYLQTYGTKAVLDRDEKANGAVSLYNNLVTAGIPEDSLRYVLDTTGVAGLTELRSTLNSRTDLTKAEIEGLVKKSKDYVAENPDEDISTVIKKAYGLYKSSDKPVERERNLFAAVLGLDARMAEDDVLNDLYVDGFTGTDIYRIMGSSGPKPGEALSLNLPTKPPSPQLLASAANTLQGQFDASIDAKIKAATRNNNAALVETLEGLKGRGVDAIYEYATAEGYGDPSLLDFANRMEAEKPGLVSRNTINLGNFTSQFNSWKGDQEDDNKLDSAPNGGGTPPGPAPEDETPEAYTPTELRAALAANEIEVGAKVVVNGKEVVITQEQVDQGKSETPSLTDDDMGLPDGPVGMEESTAIDSMFDAIANDLPEVPADVRTWVDNKPTIEEQPDVDIEAGVASIDGLTSAESVMSKLLEMNIDIPTNRRELEFFKEDLKSLVYEYGANIPDSILKDIIAVATENATKGEVMLEQTNTPEVNTKPEPLVARPKRTEQPKDMTASDKARLQRAQKANELSGDSGLLEMLVEKYGIALVQKEMGL